MNSRTGTGSKNLDLILGGGLPSESITLIAGPAGAGKSVLAHQILFSNIKENARAVYVTTLGKTVHSVLKNMQPFDFFDPITATRLIYYEDAGFLLAKEGLRKFLDFVSYSLLRYSPDYYCIDGIERLSSLSDSPQTFEPFLYELAGLLSSYHCTTFWIGTYGEKNLSLARESNSCDHILYLSVEDEGERNLKVMKLSRSHFIPGEHHYTINEQGLRVTPRFVVPSRSRKSAGKEKISWGLEPFNKLLENHLWKGETLLAKGESGSGKTATGLHFLAGGLAQEKKGALVSFKEDLADLNDRAECFNWNLASCVEKGGIGFLHTPPVEMNIDEVGLRILGLVRENGAERLFINDIHYLLQAYNGKSSRLFQYIYSLFQYFRAAGLTVFLTFSRGPQEVLFEELCDAVLLLAREEEMFSAKLVKGKGKLEGSVPVKFQSPAAEQVKA